MGAWGYEIFEDDYACDMKDEFEELCESGLSPLEATLQLLSEYDYLLDEKENDEYPIFYLVIASLQLEHGCLQGDVRNEAIFIIENEIGLDVWKEAGLNEYEERKKVLTCLKEKLEIGE